LRETYATSGGEIAARKTIRMPGMCNGMYVSTKQVNKGGMRREWSRETISCKAGSKAMLGVLTKIGRRRVQRVQKRYGEW